MKNFQLILLVIFGAAVLIAVLIFSGAIKTKDRNSETMGATGKVVMWGTVPAKSISGLLAEYNQEKETYQVTYIEKNSATFDTELTEALASGKGPDLFLLPDELLWKYRNRINLYPYESYPERSFKDNFVNGSDVFLSTSGIMALPFTVDPIVMYYNRDMFENAFIATPPTIWDDVYNVSRTLTKKDENSLISESGMAFGTWDNIKNSKDILSMLLLQGGTSITEKQDSVLDSTLLDPLPGTKTIPAQSVVAYYTEFANPVSEFYSWNRARPNSFDAFISGDLAIYFGFASELPAIRAKNPNLDFDVALVPQIKNSTTKATSANFNVIALSKFSTNPTTAYVVATQLTGKDFQSSFNEANTNYPPVRKDLLSVKPTDPYQAVFFNSALISKTWLDPNPASSDGILRGMIENYTSGSMDIYASIENASDQLSVLGEK